ncbi:MAG TPA: hypothetical protein VFW73_06070, partial [Lacipirellulaceae bacterium]|nr:hypothetical protein [Lacipirellulaceae bacterium]
VADIQSFAGLATAGCTDEAREVEISLGGEKESPTVSGQDLTSAGRAGLLGAVGQPSGLSEVEQIRAMADQGNVEDALRLCIAMIAKTPLRAILHFYRGLLLDQMSGDGAALESLYRAIYLDREFVLAHYYLGTTLLKLGNYAGASRSFRTVLRLMVGRDPAEKLPHAEGMSIGDLDELTRLHIETLEAA